MDVLFMKSLEQLLESESIGTQSVDHMVTSRAVRKLVRSWPLFKGGFLYFGNPSIFLSGLPHELLINLLTFLPIIEIRRLSLVCLLFAMPQFVLEGSRTIIGEACFRLGETSRWLRAPESKDIWLRSGSDLMTRCLVIRNKGWHSRQYTLYLQDSTRGNETIVLIAVQKLQSFHIFNVSKGFNKLTKDGGNFVGALRIHKSDLTRGPSEFTIASADGNFQYGAITFQRNNTTTISNLMSGPKPRVCFVAIPSLNKHQIPLRVQGLLTALKNHVAIGTEMPPNTEAMTTKEPYFDNAANCFRLNFHGRVTVASIKNLQVVHPVTSEVVCQFGKTDVNRFHLDFKRPFNALQAFCIALSSFSHF